MCVCVCVLLRDTVDVYTPDSSIVAIVCAQSLAVVREPDRGFVVLGNGEEEISF